jgi:ribosomal-protein-serine acetyltransferase
MFNCRIDEHVDLVMLEEHHADALFKATDDDRAHLVEWMSWMDDTTTSQDTLSYIRRCLKAHAENGDLSAGIRFDGQFVGGIGLHSTDRKNRKSEIGYWLTRGFERRGIMTRCVARLVSYAFDQMQLNRLEIRCATGNQRSRAVAERLGFQIDGTLRQSVVFRDGYHDHVVYSMLAGEWKAR